MISEQQTAEGRTVNILRTPLDETDDLRLLCKKQRALPSWIDETNHVRERNDDRTQGSKSYLQVAEVTGAILLSLESIQELQ